MKLRQCIYIPLDALVDTRLGLLRQKWPEQFEKVDVVAYSQRKTFHVWKLFGVGKDEWLAAWKNRNVDTLLHSAPTELAMMLRIAIGHLAVTAMTTPVVEKPEIVVDIHPYRMTDEERRELKAAVEEMAPENTVVTVDSIGTERLSPELISIRFDCMFLYDLVTWIATQTEELKKKQIPKVIIHYPAVLHEDDVVTLDKIAKSESNPFDDIRQECAPMFTLSAVDPTLFSIAYPAEGA